MPIIAEAGFRLIGILIQGILSSLGYIFQSAMDIIEAFVNGFNSARGLTITIGKDLISGVWNGIKGQANWLWNNVKGFFGDLLGKIKAFLGISSPSKVFEQEIGMNMARGIPIGMKKSIGSVVQSMNASLGQIVSGLSIGNMNLSLAGSGYGNGSVSNQTENYNFWAPLNINGGTSNNLGETIKARRF
jgi:phage-related protein